MTEFTIPRGQARAVCASLLPHAGKQTDDTPDFGRIRFAPHDDSLVAWTTDALTMATAWADVVDHFDDGADWFDLSTGAVKTILAVFRGPSDADARSMWESQPLRVELTDDSVILEEVGDIVAGRSLTVERMVTIGDDRYPDPGYLVRPPINPSTTALVPADRLRRFAAAARAWDAHLLISVAQSRVDVHVGSRFYGALTNLRAPKDDTTLEEYRDQLAGPWIDRLTPHVRPTEPDPDPVDVDDAVLAEAAAELRAVMRETGGVVVDLTGHRVPVAPAVPVGPSDGA